MLDQLNPTEIVLGHLRTLGSVPEEGPEKISPASVVFFFSVGIPFALAQMFILRDDRWISGEVVGVVVSSASIIAGLLLNLLVLVYTLVAAHEAKLTDSRLLFRKVAKHAFFNISFTVFASLLLVFVALMSLANNHAIRYTGNVLTFYIGPLVAVSLLMVLRKCHSLISFYFSESPP